ncbi:MAG: inositol monophosphatase [Oscillospiraceae bacterium]|nr:inositol monophosphatase [Oscillospiraceae bacterium]
MYEIIEAIVRSAGEIVLCAKHIGESVQEKSSHCDLVTKYDGMVQEYLRRELLTAFPEAGFYGEEEEEHDIAGKTAYFIVDPIDGTMNFVRHTRHSCISVGLMKDGQMEYGAVYQPYTDEMFTAQRGKGAYLNGRPMRMRDVPLSESIAMFGSAIYYRDTIPATARIMQELLPLILDFRRSGSAALDICYLAAGRADVFFEACIRPWDYAAATLIAQEAGAVVSALDGTPLRYIDRCSVAVGTPSNYPELIKIVRHVLNEPDMKGRIK